MSSPRYLSMVLALLAMFLYLECLLQIYDVSTKYDIRASILSSTGLNALDEENGALAVTDIAALWEWLLPFLSGRLMKSGVLASNRQRMADVTLTPMNKRAYKGPTSFVARRQGPALSDRNLLIVPIIVSQKRRSYTERSADEYLQKRSRLGVTEEAVEPSPTMIDFSILGVRPTGTATLVEVMDSVYMETTLNVPANSSRGTLRNVSVAILNSKLPNAFDNSITLSHAGASATLFEGYAMDCNLLTNCSASNVEYMSTGVGHGEAVPASGKGSLASKCAEKCTMMRKCAFNASPRAKQLIAFMCGTMQSPSEAGCLQKRILGQIQATVSCQVAVFNAEMSMFDCDLNKVFSRCNPTGPALIGDYVFGDAVLADVNDSNTANLPFIPYATPTSQTAFSGDPTQVPWDFWPIKGVPNVKVGLDLTSSTYMDGYQYLHASPRSDTPLSAAFAGQSMEGAWTLRVKPSVYDTQLSSGTFMKGLLYRCVPTLDAASGMKKCVHLPAISTEEEVITKVRPLAGGGGHYAGVKLQFTTVNGIVEAHGNYDSARMAAQKGFLQIRGQGKLALFVDHYVTVAEHGRYGFTYPEHHMVETPLGNLKWACVVNSGQPLYVFQEPSLYLPMPVTVMQPCNASYTDSSDDKYFFYAHHDHFRKAWPEA